MRTEAWAAASIGASVAVVASVVVVSLLDQQIPYAVMVVILAVLLAAGLIREVVVFRDPLTPGGIVALTGLLLFVLRPLTILTNGVTSPGAIADSQYFSSSLKAAGSAGLVQTLGFFVAFYVVYSGLSHLAAQRASAEMHDQEIELPLGRRGYCMNTNGVALQVILLVFCVIAVGALLMLIFSSGGIGAYVNGIANRSDFLAGRSFLVLGYVPIQIAFVMNVLHRRALSLPVWNAVNVVAVLSLALTGVSAGGRGPLVIGVVLPLVLLKQLGPKPFRLRTLGALGVALLIVAVTYSIVVRNANYDQGRSLSEFRQAPVATLLSQVTSGAETRPFDSVVRLNDAVKNDDDFRFLHGSTYAAAPSWFIPRALWADKPSGGGNTWFTSNYVPRFYGVNKVETSLSAIGEGYANFGYPGVVLAGGVLGWLGFLLRRPKFAQRAILGRTLMVCLTPLLFSIIRGDLYQGGSLAIATSILTCVVFFATSGRVEPLRQRVQDGTRGRLAG